MGTTSAGALGTPNLPQIDMTNLSGGGITGTLTPKPLTAEKIAKIAYNVNKAWCEYNGDMSFTNTWEEAPAWQRETNIKGVLFHQENPDAGPEASHNSWLAQKEAEGWVYGEKKDPDASPPTHPCIKPFEELPRDQQFKDILFRTIVRSALD